MKRALTIAASDSSAASGAQSDLKVFAACGVYGICAITLIAAQDTFAVRRLFRPAPGIVAAQIDAVLGDIGADACKIGWYRSPELTTVIAGRVRRRDIHPVVLDPCMWSDRGVELTPPRTVKRMVRELLPRATVLAVTVRELSVLAGQPVETEADLHDAVRRVRAMGPSSVVVEDAPVSGGAAVCVGDESGEEYVAETASPRVAGAGSIFSAALTAALARGESVRQAAAFAAEFLAAAAKNARPMGKGLPVVAEFSL